MMAIIVAIVEVYRCFCTAHRKAQGKRSAELPNQGPLGVGAQEHLLGCCSGT